jgi:hypothetical protein
VRRTGDACAQVVDVEDLTGGMITLVDAFFTCTVVVVVTADFGGVVGMAGVDATDTFHPQVVSTLKLYLPADVDGLWPPPPSPVWLVRLTGAPPALVLVNTKFPAALGV